MNEMVYEARVMAHYREERTPREMTKRINEASFSYLKYHFPSIEMARLNEELKKTGT